MNEIVYIIQAGILLVISIYELIEIVKKEKEIEKLKIKVKKWKRKAMKKRQRY